MVSIFLAALVFGDKDSEPDKSGLIEDGKKSGPSAGDKEGGLFTDFIPADPLEFFVLLVLVVAGIYLLVHYQRNKRA